MYIIYLPFTDTKQTGQALSNVVSQLGLGISVKRDFNAEEILGVEQDTREIRKIVREMAEYLPQEDPEKGS